MSAGDSNDVALLDLFRMEAETQVQVLTSGLLALERDQDAAGQLEQCMRAAHSLKGAARIVGLQEGVRVAHALEDCFVAAQHGRITIGRPEIDVLLNGTDLLSRIANPGDGGQASGTDAAIALDIDGCLSVLAQILEAQAPTDAPADSAPSAPAPRAPSAGPRRCSSIPRSPGPPRRCSRAGRRCSWSTWASEQRSSTSITRRISSKARA